jgi:hypothetical protein
MFGRNGVLSAKICCKLRLSCLLIVCCLCVDLCEDDLDVLKMIFNFGLGSPSPGGSRGRVRSATFLMKS